MRPVLITAAELAARLESPTPPVVLDVRWVLGGPPGHPDYLAGHIPGALYVSMNDDLAAHGKPTDGRHPLPSLADFQATARRWGLTQDSSVVVYDDNANMAAARAWWLLRWAGLDDVLLLDGALGAWSAAGLPLETGDVTVTPSSITLHGGQMPTISMAEAGSFEGVLLDARAVERYRGETEPIDPKAGHIPGALSAPTSANVDSEGRFLPAADLRARFSALGVEGPLATYCGSGVTAAHQVAALAIAGFEAALYPGSWSQWSNHDLPVETGG